MHPVWRAGLSTRPYKALPNVGDAVPQGFSEYSALLSASCSIWFMARVLLPGVSALGSVMPVSLTLPPLKGWETCTKQVYTQCTPPSHLVLGLQQAMAYINIFPQVASQRALGKHRVPQGGGMH